MEDDEAAKQPDLRIVAENSSAAVAENEAAKRLAWALRELTANLLRIVRGAGKPYNLGTNLDALIRAIADYQDAAGHSPWPEQISAALSIDRDEEWRTRLTDTQLDRLDAEELVIRGVLQQVAARLVGQRTQETMGNNDMHDGIRALEDARKELRKEWQGAPKPARAPKTVRPRRS